MVSSVRDVCSRSAIQSIRTKAAAYYSTIIDNGPLDRDRATQSGQTQRFVKAVQDGKTIHQAFCEVTGTSLTRNPLKYLRLWGAAVEELVLASAEKAERALRTVNHSQSTPFTNAFTNMYRKAIQIFSLRDSAPGKTGWDN